MENNIETKEISTEVAETAVEAIAANRNGLKPMAKAGIIGGVCVASVAAWEFVVKPLARKVKYGLSDRKAKRKLKKAKQAEVDLDEMDLEDDIPDIGR